MQRGTPAEMAPGLAHICARTRARRRSHSTETHLVGREEERVHRHRLWLDARGRQQRLENGARAQVERKQRPCANKTNKTNKQTEALRTVSAVACATQERRGLASTCGVPSERAGGAGGSSSLFIGHTGALSHGTSTTAASFTNLRGSLPQCTHTAQSPCRRGRGEPSPRADVAGKTLHALPRCCMHAPVRRRRRADTRTQMHTDACSHSACTGTHHTQ